MITTVVIVILLVLLTASIFFNVNLFMRLMEFDDLFEMLVDDITVNVKYFDKLLATPLFTASEEVRTANRNMLIMRNRLAEFMKLIGETTNTENEEDRE